MVEKLFDDAIDSPDEFYRLIRDEKRTDVIKLKSYMEDLWFIYYPYADSNFRTQLAHDFHARFWEMYLTCTLLSKSFAVVPKKQISEGPDILIQDSSRRIFMEAVTPSEGSDDNPDKVPRLKLGIATEVPDIEITLRYTGAIADKFKKYGTYLSRGIVSSLDSYIIALNSCKIDSAIMDRTHGKGEVPRIMKAVLAIGFKQVSVNKLSGPEVDWSYQYRPNISRSSGNFVSTELFLSPDYAGLSGVIYSGVDVANTPKLMGDDLIFIHNPKATAGIPNGYFKLGIEYTVELNYDKSTVSWKDTDWRQGN